MPLIGVMEWVNRYNRDVKTREVRGLLTTAHMIVRLNVERYYRTRGMLDRRSGVRNDGKRRGDEDNGEGRMGQQVDARKYERGGKEGRMVSVKGRRRRSATGNPDKHLAYRKRNIEFVYCLFSVIRKGNFSMLEGVRNLGQGGKERPCVEVPLYK